MPRNEFSQFLEKKFLEWQIKQGRRTTLKEFSKQIGVSRAAISLWLNGERTPDLINIQKLAEVFGFDVYDALGLPRPNPYLQKINQIFERLSPEHQQRLAEDAECYEVNKHEHTSKTSKRRENKQRDE
jgi:transcriptional regulator with XRE-family HTH domain